MQEKLDHKPFAMLLEPKAQKKSSQTKSSQKKSQHGEQATAQGGDAVGSKASFVKPAQAKDVSACDDAGLFLQAMDTLVSPSQGRKGATKSRSLSHASLPHASLYEASFPTAMTEKASSLWRGQNQNFGQRFGQSMGERFMKKKSHSKKQDVVQSAPTQEKGLGENPSESLSSVTLSMQPTTQPTMQPTMQELLQAEEAMATGQDGAGMDAFFTAMKGVNPLQGKGRDIAPEVQPAVSSEQGQDVFALMLEKKLEFSLALKGEYIEGHVVGLDELTMNNLRAGVYSPEAHLDLHGLNAMQAYTAMVGFFKGSWFKGLRTLLLIPGRGKNSPNGISVLREKVQLWLTQEPFKRVVLAFCTAQPVDGGPGTVYVLLRKYKKKGKVCWERLPSDPDLY